jgi:hypothetical protein
MQSHCTSRTTEVLVTPSGDNPQRWGRSSWDCRFTTIVSRSSVHRQHHVWIAMQFHRTSDPEIRNRDHMISSSNRNWCIDVELSDLLNCIWTAAGSYKHSINLLYIWMKFSRVLLKWTVVKCSVVYFLYQTSSLTLTLYLLTMHKINILDAYLISFIQMYRVLVCLIW